MKSKAFWFLLVVLFSYPVGTKAEEKLAKPNYEKWVAENQGLTRYDKITLSSFVSLQAADLATSLIAQNQGLTEGNTLLKNRSVLIGTKVVFSGSAIYFHHRFPRQRRTINKALWIVNGIYTVVLANNLHHLQQ